MYFGFSRIINIQEIKTRYMYVALGQELLLQTLPLTFL